MKSFFRKVGSFFKKYLTIVIIALIFLFLFICDKLPTNTGNMVMDNLKSIATSFTPTTDLFDDGSEVSFVSYFFGMHFNDEANKAEFYKPTSQENLSSSDEFLSYSYDGVISSISNGVVRAVGYTTNNEKYIEIEHFEGYVSRYVGLSTVGVTTGDKVGAKNAIGIVSSDRTLRIYLHKNNDIVKTSEIEWKD